MLFRWMVLLCTTLFSLWLLKIFMSQKQMLEELKRQNERLIVRSAELVVREQAEELYRSNMDLQVNSGRSVAQELAAKMPEMISDSERRNSESEACEAKLETLKLELENSKKGQSTTKDLIKSETEQWNKEIKTLQKQLADRSPICSYVKEDPKAAELCASTSSKI